jgi:hypothetical protein
MHFAAGGAPVAVKRRAMNASSALKHPVQCFCDIFINNIQNSISILTSIHLKLAFS